MDHRCFNPIKSIFQIARMPDMDTQIPDEEIELGSLVVETAENPQASVIWLHGLGADGHDFEAIVPQLLMPASIPIRFIFPDAPIRAVTINGGYMMRAWYDIYEEIAEDAQQDAEGIEASANMLHLMVEQEIARGIAPERIILAGFSQGGAIALYAGLHARQPLGGIMALSTYLPLADTITSTNSDYIPSVFMAHGSDDPVIPIEYAEWSKQRLKALGLCVDWNTYPMAHQVNADEMLAIREWLIERLG